MKRTIACLQGLLIGGSMSVPGVSGGTVAMAAGCYETVLSAAAHPKEKGNLRYLLSVGLGGALGFFTAAQALNLCMRYLPLTVTLVFLGAAAGGIAPQLRGLFSRSARLRDGLYFTFGVLCVLAVQRLPDGTSVSPLLYFPLGAALAAGVILPGISTSHLLLTFGLYDDVTGIRDWNDLLRLLPLFLGVLAGLALLTRPLEKLWKRHPRAARYTVCGFAVGSFAPLFTVCAAHPRLGYLPAFQIGTGIILCAGAYFGMRRLQKTEKATEM